MASLGPHEASVTHIVQAVAVHHAVGRGQVCAHRLDVTPDGAGHGARHVFGGRSDIDTDVFRITDRLDALVRTEVRAVHVGRAHQRVGACDLKRRTGVFEFAARAAVPRVGEHAVDLDRRPCEHVGVAHDGECHRVLRQVAGCVACIDAQVYRSEPATIPCRNLRRSDNASTRRARRADVRVAAVGGHLAFTVRQRCPDRRRGLGHEHALSRSGRLHDSDIHGHHARRARRFGVGQHNPGRIVIVRPEGRTHPCAHAVRCVTDGLARTAEAEHKRGVCRGVDASTATATESVCNLAFVQRLAPQGNGRQLTDEAGSCGQRVGAKVHDTGRQAPVRRFGVDIQAQRTTVVGRDDVVPLVETDVASADDDVGAANANARGDQSLVVDSQRHVAADGRDGRVGAFGRANPRLERQRARVRAFEPGARSGDREPVVPVKPQSRLHRDQLALPIARLNTLEGDLLTDEDRRPALRVGHLHAGLVDHRCGDDRRRQIDAEAGEERRAEVRALAAFVAHTNLQAAIVAFGFVDRAEPRTHVADSRGRWCQRDRVRCRSCGNVEHERDRFVVEATGWARLAIDGQTDGVHGQHARAHDDRLQSDSTVALRVGDRPLDDVRAQVPAAWRTRSGHVTAHHRDPLGRRTVVRNRGRRRLVREAFAAVAAHVDAREGRREARPGRVDDTDDAGHTHRVAFLIRDVERNRGCTERELRRCVVGDGDRTAAVRGRSGCGAVRRARRRDRFDAQLRAAGRRWVGRVANTHGLGRRADVAARIGGDPADGRRAHTEPIRERDHVATDLGAHGRGPVEVVGDRRSVEGQRRRAVAHALRNGQRGRSYDRRGVIGRTGERLRGGRDRAFARGGDDAEAVRRAAGQVGQRRGRVRSSGHRNLRCEGEDALRGRVQGVAEGTGPAVAACVVDRLHEVTFSEVPCTVGVTGEARRWSGRCGRRDLGRRANAVVDRRRRHVAAVRNTELHGIAAARCCTGGRYGLTTADPVDEELNVAARLVRRHEVDPAGRRQLVRQVVVPTPDDHARSAVNQLKHEPALVQAHDHRGL